jgi:hypothetical protein
VRRRRPLHRLPIVRPNKQTKTRSSQEGGLGVRSRPKLMVTYLSAMNAERGLLKSPDKVEPCAGEGSWPSESAPSDAAPLYGG